MSAEDDADLDHDEEVGGDAGIGPLDPKRCYEAIRRKDTRFDGRFFVGVKTTGIFCRPVCPAPSPKAINCTYWLSAAAAQAAGFRPCFRCRPESAPGTPAWQGTAASVSRALRLIEAGALDQGGTVDALADRLGMGSRHLRRLFETHLGATPRAVARMRRILFAKQLIDETDLSMNAIARSAGFSSQRRFNACLREVYGCAPSDLRKRSGGRARGRGPGEAIELSLRFRPPLAWGPLLDFFALRAIPGVEAVSDGCYRRTVRMAGGQGLIEVCADAERSRLRVGVRATNMEGLIELRSRLRQVFDLDVDAERVDEELARVPLLEEQVAEVPGMRVPGAYDGFETAVRGILGQQVSVKGATTIAGRVAERFGEELDGSLIDACGDARNGPALTHLFPTAAQLVEAPLEEVGLIRARANTIRGLARAVIEDSSLLEAGASLEAGIARWTALSGVGPWTAHYVAMRVLGEADALPASDLVLRQRISSPGAPTRPARDVEEMLAPASPYRAYGAIRVWALRD